MLADVRSHFGEMLKFLLLCLAACRALEKSHGACTRASNFNVRRFGNGTNIKNKRLRKPVKKRMRKMMATLIEFGSKMEPKRIQTGIKQSMLPSFFASVF
jgi:hypothetical protein